MDSGGCLARKLLEFDSAALLVAVPGPDLAGWKDREGGERGGKGNGRRKEVGWLVGALSPVKRKGGRGKSCCRTFGFFATVLETDKNHELFAAVPCQAVFAPLTYAAHRVKAFANIVILI